MISVSNEIIGWAALKEDMNRDSTGQFIPLLQLHQLTCFFCAIMFIETLKFGSVVAIVRYVRPSC
jgi:hypothetical protein